MKASFVKPRAKREGSLPSCPFQTLKSEGMKERGEREDRKER